VEPVESGEKAVRGADIVVTATSAMKIVLEGPWLSPGVHVNRDRRANWRLRSAELDDGGCHRPADAIVVDSIEQAKMEAGDLILSFANDATRWDVVRELGAIVARKDSRKNRPKSIHVQVQRRTRHGDCRGRCAYINWRSHEAWDNPSLLWEAQVRRRLVQLKKRRTGSMECSGEWRGHGAAEIMQFLEKLKPLGRCSCCPGPLRASFSIMAIQN